MTLASYPYSTGTAPSYNPMLLQHLTPSFLTRHALFTCIAGLRAVADFFKAEVGDAAAAAVDAFTLNDIADRHSGNHR